MRPRSENWLRSSGWKLSKSGRQSTKIPGKSVHDIQEAWELTAVVSEVIGKEFRLFRAGGLGMLGTLTGATVRYCLVILRMALDHACNLDLVPRNVAALVDFPKVEHAEIEPYTPEQAQKLIEATKGRRLGALFSVALAIGLRKGEALALKWSAVGFERGALAVRLALQRVKMPGGLAGTWRKESDTTC